MAPPPTKKSHQRKKTTRNDLNKEEIKKRRKLGVGRATRLKNDDLFLNLTFAMSDSKPKSSKAPPSKMIPSSTSISVKARIALAKELKLAKIESGTVLPHVRSAAVLKEFSTATNGDEYGRFEWVRHPRHCFDHRRCQSNCRFL